MANQLALKIEQEYEDSEDVFGQIKEETIGRWYYDKKKGQQLHIAEYLDMTEINKSSGRTTNCLRNADLILEISWTSS
ncbi:MAG: hypothetical protein ABEJ07_01750 [Candidatus Nanohaloarchaea archaeon]